MGKAEIIEHIGAGQYRIKLLRDRTWLDGRIAWAEGRIATLQSERVPLADDVDAKQADLNALLAEINDLVSQSPIDRDAVRVKNIEAIRAREALSQTRVVLARHDAELHSIEKRLAGWQAIVNNLEADERDVWCADLSTTLAGEHPTLEVNGTSSHALLMPGTMPNEYTGDLVPTLSMTPAQAAYNFALHPGWQRWTPTFRIATITALSVAQDTCSVVLSGAADRYQGLQINEHVTLDNLPVAYMTCDAQAFAIGDEVVVMFQGQSWDSPVVVGFKEQPKDCGGNMVLIVASKSGAEAFAYDILDETVLVEKTTLAGVLSTLEGMGFDGEPQVLTPSLVVESEISLVEGPDFSAERINLSDDVPTLWASKNYGLRGRMLFPHSTVSAGETTALSGSFWDGAKFDDVDTVNVKLDYLQNPFTAELEAHLVYDYINNSAYRGNTVTGSPLLQYMNHSVFDNRFPKDVDLPADNNDAMYFLYVRWQFFGTGFYFFNLNMGEMDSLFTVVEQEPVHIVDFQSVKCGVATNDSGSVIVEDGLYYVELPHAGYYGDSFRKIRLFARDMNPVKSDIEAKAMDLINFERTQRDLEPYVWNHVLNRACVRHSDDMAANLFLSHTGTDASEPDNRVEDAGWRLHATVGMITQDNHPTQVGESGSPGTTESLASWNTENAGRTFPGVDPLEDPPHNVDIAIYQSVIAQEEYATLGQAEIMVALWMASTEGHREALLDEDCGGYVPEAKGEGYGANEMAISAVAGSDGGTYWTFLAGRKFWHWAGFGCVDTEPVRDYVATHFVFADAEQFTPDEGWWFIPGGMDRGDVVQPHWFKKPLNHRSEFGFGPAPIMPAKKELEFYLI